MIPLIGSGISPLILSLLFTVWRFLGASQLYGIGAYVDMGVLACFPVDTMDEEFILEYAITRLLLPFETFLFSSCIFCLSLVYLYCRPSSLIDVVHCFFFHQSFAMTRMGWRADAVPG